MGSGTIPIFQHSFGKERQRMESVMAEARIPVGEGLFGMAGTRMMPAHVFFYPPEFIIG